MPEPERWLDRARLALQEGESLLAGRFFAASVSRSYYAMFYAAKGLLASRGVSPKSHGGTLQKLGELFVKQAFLPSEAAAEMGAAMELREQADYEVDPFVVDEDRARQTLDAARRFVDRAAIILQPR